MGKFQLTTWWKIYAVKSDGFYGNFELSSFKKLLKAFIELSNFFSFLGTFPLI